MNILEILHNVDFLKDVPDTDLQDMGSMFQLVHYRSDDIIFREYDPGDYFFILVEGTVEITKQISGETGAEAELTLFSPYEYFGEMAVIDDSPRSATARAQTDVILQRIHKHDMLLVFDKYPQLLFRLLRTISKRLRFTNEQFTIAIGRLLHKNKMEAIGSAASKIVHDLKAPLTVILLTAQLLESRFPGTERLIKKIVNQSYLIDDMVREILDYTKGGQIALDIRPVEIEAVLQEIHENLTLLAADHDIRLSFTSSIKEPVCFDVKRIKRVLTNLVKNAIEAMREPGEIHIECERDGEMFHLQVSDTGPGIPEDILDTLFEPFVTKGKADGTGLGLAICQKVVTDHGGTIVASNWEHGARFDIHLPYRTEPCEV
jgi:signal transduction histidine kinase